MYSMRKQEIFENISQRPQIATPDTQLSAARLSRAHLSILEDIISEISGTCRSYRILRVSAM